MPTNLRINPTAIHHPVTSAHAGIHDFLLVVDALLMVTLGI
jgi:hypothetical protein